MALTLNTPGVYVEEVNLLPPSVAQVATAIPAFIGYTEKALALDGSPLRPDPTAPPVPVRITSMLDYETQFGKAQNQAGITVSVSDSGISADLPPASRSKFLMYYSVQMYFANGGGPCYIVSVDDGYATPPDAVTIKKGLTVLEKEDEPTLILFTDVTSLAPSDAYSLYNDALAQCNKLQDRFTIIDVAMSNLTTVNTTTDFLNLRNLISGNADYTKYGASYYPYLKTILDYQYDEAAVAVNVTSSGDFGADVQAISTGPVTTIKGLLAGYITDLAGISPTLSNVTNIRNKVLEISNSSASLIGSLTQMVNIGRGVIASNPGDPDLPALLSATNALDTWTTNYPELLNFNLSQNLDTLNAATDNAEVSDAKDDITASLTTADLVANITIIQNTNGDIADLILALAPFSSSTSATNLAALKISNNALYNSIKSVIGQLPVLLPPSSSVAGVYAQTDANNGVWKAPANVSLNYVIGPNYNISNDLQDGMNVDTVAGKSINAIRAFTGKGTLVWGARTLDGNSAEWKYVSVRRFYNMVEESVKKATEGFVFQANDANTWVKVRAMIENFLILQWKAGALAGAKPEQAFYVKIGLGSTMSADDILNGRMIVEIGMAVVRPAEFIVLRFSHMMQQA
ncbi:phage tail sheath C-terminal domain-containing protein [Fluviicola sp.]|uniref:phage tail sheath family protein n=1 Tax=Fluviicola sp. TaxID=1917219 RepID=UPI002613CD8A|nr:phage tail sheath C-terminal domain-containing protein [Fluviicola sp.]